MVKSKGSPSKEIIDSRHLQDQSRNEMQKSYFLTEVSRLCCKDAALNQVTTDSLRAECVRVRNIAQSLRRKKK